MWQTIIHGATLAGTWRRSNRGVAILFAVSVLPLLAILGVVFATTSRMERSIAASYVDGARARMLAISGIDTAAARLRAIPGNRAWSSIRDAWYCPDAPSVPVTALTRPSYDAGRRAFTYAFSIAAAGTHSDQGDIVTLRVTDCAACIHVNDRQATLGRMLDALGWAVGTQDGVAVPADGWGDRVIAARDAEPNRRFRDEDHLRQTLRRFAPQDLADRLMPYLTIWAWMDPNVTVPRPAGAGNASEAVEAPDFQKDAAGNVVGRAPVDLNTAPEPVLVACLAGIEGLEFDLSGYGGWRYVRTIPIPRDKAKVVAQMIGGYRQRVGDFHTWEEFHLFADALAMAGVLSQSQADAVKANANPNTLLNRFHPNREVAFRVSKADLTYATTEFSFDAMGYFRVESLARVLAKDGSEVASSRAIGVFKAYDAVRVTSQDQFETYRTQGGAATMLSLPEQMLARGGTIDRTKRGAACDGQLVPAPAAANASGVSLLYDLRTGFPTQSQFNQWNPAVKGLKETRSVFSTSGSQGSDVLAEGLSLDSLRKRIAAWSPDCVKSDENDYKSGTVEWWTKFDRLAPKTERIGFWGFFGRWRVDDIPLVGSIDSLVKHRLLGLTAGNPQVMAAYGANAFGFQGAFKFGNNVASTRPGMYAPFETGTWHHVAVSWRDGFVTNLYIDGVRVVNDEYESGGKRTMKERLNRMLVGCDVDTTSNGTPIPRTAYFIEGTVDGVVATRGKKYDGPAFQAPRRYDGRPCTWRGAVPFASQRPTAVFRSVSYTAYVPRKDNRGMPTLPGQGPSVRVQVELPGGTLLEVRNQDERPIDSPGRGVMVGRVLANGQRIPIEVTMTATGVAPILDDVTVTWVDSLKFLSFQID